MGYWSIMSSVDRIQDHTYLTSLSADSAVAALESTLPIAARVTCDRIGEHDLQVTTVNYTPAWAFVLLVAVCFIRQTRQARISVESQPAGSAIRVDGDLDTQSAARLRALRTMSPVGTR
jgi:hypothetical protein